MVHRAVWLIGGDGWAYDIGSGGLDHALSTGRNINVLVLILGFIVIQADKVLKRQHGLLLQKFATAGKRVGKKDLAKAISYGNVYVATVAIAQILNKHYWQCVKRKLMTVTSLILAYSHCIAHGIDMEKGLNQQKWQFLVVIGH